MSAPLDFNSRSWRWLTRPPVHEADRLVICCACDSAYLDYALALVRSVDVFAPGHCFALHVVNPSPHDLLRIERLQTALASTRLATSIESIDLANATQEQARCFYACARFLMLPELLSEFNRPILCLDADSLIVNPIDSYFSDEDNTDIVMFCEQLNDSVAAKRKVKNGTIVVQSNRRVAAFLDDVRNEIIRVFSQEHVSWYVDQEVVAQELQKQKYDLRLGHVRQAYADWTFLGSSIVWAAKGNRKHAQASYRVLMQMLSDRRPEVMDVPPIESVPTSRCRAPVAIYLPRLDLPWKLRPVALPLPKINDDTLSLRLHWKRFAVRLANTLERLGVPVDIIEVPAVEITPEAIDARGHRVAFVPHRCRLDFRPGQAHVLFYMQAYFRWVFVVDALGWSAASSKYPFDATPSRTIEGDGPFNAYRSQMSSGELSSKFQQGEHMPRPVLIESHQIPERAYVFFPLQIPHDQSIRYFSDYSEEEVVDALLAWSQEHGVPVVFKPHPVSQKLMKPFEERVRAAGAYWSTAHVQDLIRHSAAVFTINSGVGFEALLHAKPVVTFGRAEYDCVTVHATPSTVHEAWKISQASTVDELEQRYRQFVDHFLSSYAIDLSSPALAQTRLDEVAAMVQQELAA